jgi:hypothetical protein
MLNRLVTPEDKRPSRLNKMVDRLRNKGPRQEKDVTDRRPNVEEPTKA